MAEKEIESALVERFVSLGQIQGESLAEQILSAVRQFLTESIELPRKSDLLKALSDSLDKVFAGVDTPGPDMITEPALKALLLGLAGFIYDQIDGVVVV